MLIHALFAQAKHTQIADRPIKVLPDLLCMCVSPSLSLTAKKALH